MCECEREASKVNVWLGMHPNDIMVPFYFIEKTVMGHVYLDMLENFAVPQIPPGFLFQQDAFHHIIMVMLPHFLI
ncbi:hypothetical protein TNCV_3506221 [Trichonephila clavipes]|uniref:Uncharacterized protein n=1 Tax=Trichonephila clavipes TaxID=2585209 RepID=A0A8X6S4I7_TRICX|nr:hypothetical protein TNCV_3506221 [Trichonephila clavipes]